MNDKGDTKITDIERTRMAVIVFLKKTLCVKEVKVVKVAKVEDGWEAEAEIFEESSFIKSLGLPTRVQDQNIYTVKLSSSLEVESYERKGQARLTE